MISHTLSVHKVRNRNWVFRVDIRQGTGEDSIGVGLLGSNSHVLLAEMAHLGLDGDRLLQAIRISDYLINPFECE